MVYKRYLELEPAKAFSKPTDKIEPLWNDEQWVIEEKLDGYRFLMHVGKDLPRTYMTGRRVSVKTGKLSEKGLCAPMLWPKSIKKLGYTVIDGEVLPPDGAKFRDIAGIMNVAPEDAAKRIKETGPPEYHAFDILYADGEDVREMPWSWRKQALHELLIDVWGKNDLVWMVDHTGEDKLRAYEDWVANGGEGCILKDQDASYGTGWIKVKRFSTLDVIATGFTEAKHGVTGKYDGLIGAIVVSVRGRDDFIEVGQVSGMTDDERHRISTHRSEYLGTVLEIRAQEMAKDRLRHPRFARWRPEADPKDCTMQKLLDDLKAGG